jgi:membrane protein required for colicin V production
MAIIDLLLLIPILLGAFKGYKKGLLVEIVGVAAFVGAIVMGFKFLSIGAQLLGNFVGHDTLQSASPYLSFLVVFFPTIFIIRKMGWLMRKSLRMTFLGTLDGFLGAFLGGFTAMFAVSVLLWLVAKTGFVLPQNWMEDNRLYAFTLDFAPKCISQLLDWVPFGGNWVEYLSSIKNRFQALPN